MGIFVVYYIIDDLRVIVISFSEVFLFKVLRNDDVKGVQSPGVRGLDGLVYTERADHFRFV